MKRYFAVIIIIFILSGYSSFPQGKTKNNTKEKETPQELFDDAEFFYESEDYKEALYDYLLLHDQKPDNANINFHIGMCYLNIPGEEKKAVPFLEQAVTKISTKYKSTFEETRAPLHAMFYLGIAYRIDNQLTKSVDVLTKFRNNRNFEGNYNESMVDQEIQSSQRAKMIQDNPINIRRTNLGPPINNNAANYNPVVTTDESIIVYVNSLKFYNAIYMSRKENGVWSEPVNISPQVGSDGDCEPTCISANGKDLYLVKKTKNNFHLYASHWKDSSWTQMVALNKNINSSKNENHASISADGKTLYFTSDRRGGFGKFDIYKSEKDASGDWGPAVNLGNKINTEFNESTPFICEDGKTLYFSSEGHLNMGGYDVFVSHLKADKQWEEPTNAGFPINTTGNDLFYYPLKNGKIAYYSLILPEGYGDKDIYRIENLTVAAQDNTITGQKSKIKKIIVRDKETNEILGIMQYDEEADSLKVQQKNDKIIINIDQ
jgi:hypothetical protein